MLRQPLDLVVDVFHHHDPATKAFPLDARNCSNRSNEVLAAEAAKCDLLCANCHAEIEEELYLGRIRSDSPAQELLVLSEGAC